MGILTILKNIKNIFIIIFVLLFLGASGTAVFYKIKCDRIIKKAQAEQIKYYERAQKEIKKHTDRINKLSGEREALKRQIEKLKIEGKCQNEDYYRLYDSVTDRFNSGL